MKPILFNSKMILKILSGEKTQTRRPVKTEKPPFNVNDVLYIRETFSINENDNSIIYKATSKLDACPKWTPSIHMPRQYARTFLIVTGLRVEPITQISEEDAKREGFDASNHPVSLNMGWSLGARHNFKFDWQKIYGDQSWSQKKLAWVIDFKIINKFEESV